MIEDKLITLLVSPYQTVLINEKSYKSDENGKIIFSMHEIIQRKKGLAEFDRFVSGLISDHYKDILYEAFVSMSRRFGINEISNVVGLDRSMIKEILIAGIRHGVLAKADSQWKIADVSIRSTLKELLMIKEQTASFEVPAIDEGFTASQRETLQHPPKITRKKRVA